MTTVRVYTKDRWLAIPGYEGYEVAADARVRSLDRTINGVFYRGKELKTSVDDLGYLSVGIRSGKSCRARVHRLIALAFHGEPPFDGAVVRHLNDEKLDNRPENLAWGSRSQNAIDSVRNGTHRRIRTVQTNCKRGHPLSGANVSFDPKGGARRCKACMRVRAVSYQQSKNGAAAFKKENKMPVIRVYTKPNCGPCMATKHALSANGLAYIEEDAMDEGNLLAFKELGFLAAPVVAVGESRDDMWSGFQPDRIKEIAERLNKQEEK